MDPRRAVRVAEALREELEEIILYELADHRIETAGIAEVLISPDGRHAHIRLILKGEKAQQQDTLEALKSARNHLRNELGRRLHMFRLPELHFEPAIPGGYTPRIDHLLKRVRKGRVRPDPSETTPASAPAPKKKSEE